MNCKDRKTDRLINTEAERKKIQKKDEREISKRKRVRVRYQKTEKVRETLYE